MRKIYFVLSVIVVAITNSNAQPYQIGHTTFTFIDASRSNRNIATEIYYPSDVAGDNVALTTSNSLKFPSLVFGHGFVMTWDAYQNFWETLVPNGYIIAFPKSEGSFSPSHLEFGKDLAFVINQMNILGTQNTSIFFNRVSNKNAVMGHSMGGGASFLSVPLNPNITTLVNFAAAETTPSAITASASISIPSLIFAGANDCVAPPTSNQVPLYNGLTSSCKTYISMVGASHCQMSNSNSLCNFGEASCTPTPTISRTVQHVKIFSYLLPWLNYQLKLECSQGAIFDSQIITDTAITFQKNCIQCGPALSSEFNSLDNEIVLFPNPANDFIYVKGIAKKEYSFKIRDTNSKIVLQVKITESQNIDISKLSSEVYFYEVIDLNNKTGKGKFIKN
jgi:pimeloyl-ACP methyl ester carboxylesterase